MRRIFWGFCRNWVLIDPLHYLSSRSAIGFEFAEIFVIEKRLPDSPSRGVDDSPTRRVGELATPRLAESGISDSQTRQVFLLTIQKPTPRLTYYEYLRKFEAKSGTARKVV